MTGAQYIVVLSPVEGFRKGSLLWKHPGYISTLIYSAVSFEYYDCSAVI